MPRKPIPYTKTRFRSLKAVQLQRHRRFDRTGWKVDDSSIQRINQDMKIDLKRIISEHLKGKHGRILDLGCTKGRALGELRRLFGNQLTLHGTSVAYLKEWEKAKKQDKIYFIVCHFQQLTKKFKEGYFDVIYSFGGARNAIDINETLKQVRTILKKRGLFVFNTDEKNIDLEGFRIIQKESLSESKFDPLFKYVLQKD